LVAALALLTGVLLIVGSVLSHTNKATFSQIGKTLGYFYEVNWSVNYVVAIPIALYFCASAMNAIRHVIAELAKNKMIVGANGKPRDRVYLLNDWHRLVKRFLYVGLVLALLAIAISWREWFQNFAYDPALGVKTVMAQTGLLPGWNLAPTVNGQQFFRQAKMFGFFAFTVQGLVAGFYILFICVIYGFATWIYRFTTDSTSDELVPDVASPDPRKGFERFEPLIETLLSAALAGSSTDPCVGRFLEFRVVRNPATPDVSQVPAVMIPNPDLSAIPVARTRTFVFGDGASQNTNDPVTSFRGPWGIGTDSGEVLNADFGRISAAPSFGTREIWNLVNDGGGWDHPVHIHFEEGQILKRNGSASNVPAWEKGRKDVYRLRPDGSVQLTMQFRDFGGMFMEHCHNTLHEDNAMLLRWEIDDGGSPFLRPLPTPIPTPQGVRFQAPTVLKF